MPASPLSWTPEAWASFLSSELDCAVRVEFGRSRSVPIQTRAATASRTAKSRLGRARHPQLLVRMHSMFAHAPEDVRESVAKWLRSGRRARRACTLLDRWIHESLECLPPRAPRRTALQTQGEWHDLGQLTRDVLEHELEGDLQALVLPGVTWGPRRKSRSRRSLRLGSFDADSNVVRIHPVLDQAAVPNWFVRFVLFHEHLHAVHPPAKGPGGRMVHHGSAFRMREKRHHDYQRALAWEDTNVPRLITSARTGKPMRVRKEDLLELASEAPRRRKVRVTQLSLFA